MSAFVGQEPIDASWSDDNLTLSIEREDVGSPAQGEDLSGVSAESRHGDNGDTFDDTVAGDYRIGNSAPDLASIGDKAIDEGQKLNFNVSATDADGDAVTLSASGVPAGASFTSDGDADGDGTYNATFTWDTTTSDAGDYTPIFTADDGSNTNGEIVLISVTEKAAPELDPIDAQFVDEGDSVSLTLTATDPDGDQLTLSASNLPADASFADAGDGTGTFSWTPAFGDAGSHVVSVTADDGHLSDTVTTTIEVESDTPVLEIEMRHDTVSPTEDPRVAASVFMSNSGQPLSAVQIDITAYWNDAADPELRFEQQASGQTTSSGESPITLDRDFQDLVNAPGEHIVEASVSWQDPATGQTFDLSGSTSYTVG